jgi:two-component sensor histidine kinase
MTVDITERKELEDHKNALISELDHRVKNVLAIVSTVASRTQETSSSMSEFVSALDSRIKSMATTHEQLAGHPACGTRASSAGALCHRQQRLGCPHAPPRRRPV